MTSTSITPIQHEHLAAAGQFLHENLNQRISAADWIASLTHPWSETRPNYGMQLHEGNKLAGVFCAIYSEQMIDGRMEKFCNPHSWCVLPDYRNHGIGLVLSIIKQRGYHYTMLTPNPKVAEIFRQLRFKDLGAEVAVFANVPTLGGARGGVVETRPDALAQLLPPAARRAYELHHEIRWLRFVAFGREGDMCLVAYKTGRWKKLPCARILHVSDAGAFQRHLPLLRRRLLLNEGFATCRVETRLIGSAPRFSWRMTRTQAKLYMSPTLRDSQITDLYSELASLDI
jgi:hypothetical protein